MSSLIVTVISIALAVAVAIVAVSYGGTVYTNQQQKAIAAGLASQASQLFAAMTLYKEEHGEYPATIEVLYLDGVYLAAPPVPPSPTYTEAVPSLISYARAESGPRAPVCTFTPDAQGTPADCRCDYGWGDGPEATDMSTCDAWGATDSTQGGGGAAVLDPSNPDAFLAARVANGKMRADTYELIKRQVTDTERFLALARLYEKKDAAGDVPSAADWVWPVGMTPDNRYVAIPGKVGQKTCEAVNFISRGVTTIPTFLLPGVSIQCFGTAAPYNYVYLNPAGYNYTEIATTIDTGLTPDPIGATPPPAAESFYLVSWQPGGNIEINTTPLDTCPLNYAESIVDAEAGTAAVRGGTSSANGIPLSQPVVWTGPAQLCIRSTTEMLATVSPSAQRQAPNSGTLTTGHWGQLTYTKELKQVIWGTCEIKASALVVGKAASGAIGGKAKMELHVDSQSLSVSCGYGAAPLAPSETAQISLPSAEFWDYGTSPGSHVASVPDLSGGYCGYQVMLDDAYPAVQPIAGFNQRAPVGGNAPPLPASYVKLAIIKLPNATQGEACTTMSMPSGTHWMNVPFAHVELNSGEYFDATGASLTEGNSGAYGWLGGQGRVSAVLLP